MRVLAYLVAATILTATPALAQHEGHAPPPSTTTAKGSAEEAPAEPTEMAWPETVPDEAPSEPTDMAWPENVPEPKPAPADQTGTDHSGMDHSGMDHSGMDHSGMDHSGMDHAAMGHGAPDIDAGPVGDEPAPAPPADHAADALFSREAMDAARAQLSREHGGSRISMVSLGLAEHQWGEGEQGFRWDGEAWYGGDIHRAVLKAEGESRNGEGVADAEVQLLYSRAIGPYFDLQAGVRHDFEPHPTRTYAVLGIEGLAPYWIDAEAAFFLSTRGELRARAQAAYDLRITQRWILQPRLEVNLSAQDTREIGVGSGITDVDLGLRLRFAATRTVAPYVGISHGRRYGRTADYARLAGEAVSDTRFVVGVRTWF